MLQHSTCDSHLLKHDERWPYNLQIKLTPSTVAVPRPSSSRITKLFSVALCRISLVSDISTMKVERPRANSSDAECQLVTIEIYWNPDLPPILVKMPSNIPSLKDCAGTNDPICAMMAMSAIIRTEEDFPPIFGPVITDQRV